MGTICDKRNRCNDAIRGIDVILAYNMAVPPFAKNTHIAKWGHRNLYTIFPLNDAHGNGALSQPTMASTASMTEPRKPSFSSWATPLMVVPPGEQTASFMAPGWVSVAMYSAPTPSTILAAKR